MVLQVAFVDPPELDFDLQLPSDSHGSGLLDYVEGWADAFITDSILSQYVLPDHYFSQIDSVGPLTGISCLFIVAQVDSGNCTTGYPTRLLAESLKHQSNNTYSVQECGSQSSLQQTLEIRSHPLVGYVGPRCGICRHTW